MENSPMFHRLDKKRQAQFSRLDYETYTGLEEAINCLGRVLTLSFKDQSDPFMLEALAELKYWCVITTLQHRSRDPAVEYLKWVAKSTQAAFLQSAVPEPPRARPGLFLGHILPFAGPLGFISDILLSKRDRSKGLTLEEGRSMAQMASLSRALPYPSGDQIREAVAKTVDLVVNEPPALTPETKALYREGLAVIEHRLGAKVRSNKTHVSLAGSGSLDSSRTEGGRGRDLVRLARPCCDLEVTAELLSVMEGKQDVFGQVPLSLLNAEILRRLIKKHPDRRPKLGVYLYQDVTDLKREWESPEGDASRVPPKLAQIFNLVCSADLLKYGRYSTSCEVVYGMLLFPAGSSPEFIPEVKALPVRADLSVEAGLKTRLTTSASSSFVHFGQQIGHIMRRYLRTDPFLQVGFEEPDKLWEVLKAYRKAIEKKDLTVV